MFYILSTSILNYLLHIIKFSFGYKHRLSKYYLNQRNDIQKLHFSKILQLPKLYVRFSLTINFRFHEYSIKIPYKYNQFHRLKLTTLSTQKNKIKYYEYSYAIHFFGYVKPFKTGWMVHVKVLYTWKQYNFVSRETLEIILSDERICFESFFYF